MGAQAVWIKLLTKASLTLFSFDLPTKIANAGVVKAGSKPCWSLTPDGLVFDCRYALVLAVLTPRQGQKDKTPTYMLRYWPKQGKSCLTATAANARLLIMLRLFSRACAAVAAC